MTILNTNISAIAAQNSLRTNNLNSTSAMERLSSGIRINSAKDDAAGLAISTRMTANIRGISAAIRNANDGISMLQTSEGAMIEQTNMLQRMRELAVQASTDTVTPDQKNYLNAEFQQLKQEINRIGTSTQWNGKDLLNGNGGSGDGTILANLGTYTFQVGANGTPTSGTNTNVFSVTIGKLIFLAYGKSSVSDSVTILQ